ncbi:MAG TPA: hypothetical protein VGK60_02060 [Pedococcus sp.]|jgi:hypothetical protein
MSEHDRNLAEMGPEQGAEQDRAQALMQDAIDEVRPRAVGLAGTDIVELLSAALEARGIGPQPPTWLAAVADEIGSGGTYVEDPAAAAYPPEDFA